MIFSNVIFPAPATFYVLGMFVPIAIVAALIAEWVTFFLREPDAAKKPKLFFIIFAANFCSWIIGAVLTWYAPALISELLERGQSVSIDGENGAVLAIAGLVFAYVLSVAIEYYFIRLVFGNLNWTRLFRTTWIANSISYLVYMGVVFLLARFL